MIRRRGTVIVRYSAARELSLHEGRSGVTQRVIADTTPKTRTVSRMDARFFPRMILFQETGRSAWPAKCPGQR